MGSEISEVRDKVKSFLQEAIDAEGVRVVSISKVNGGWLTKAEVTEKNQYLASIKSDYRVLEKETYIVKLSARLDVFSYKRIENGEDELEDINYEL